MLVTDLTENISNIKGVGQKSAEILEKIGIITVSDLINYFPRAYSDRSKLLTLNEAVLQGYGTVKLKVLDHRLIGNKYRKILKVIVQDEKDQFGALLCFNRNFLGKALVKDKSYYITGKYSKNYNEIQTNSFEYEEAINEYEGKIYPIYPLTAGINQNQIRKLIKHVLNHYCKGIISDLPEYCEKEYKLLTTADAYQNIHFPLNLNNYHKARESLIFQEFFFQKLFLLERKEKNKKMKKKKSNIKFNYRNTIIKNLPFELMDYQKEALVKIEEAMFSPTVFSILLQGDVGSGKTITALLAMLSAVEAGYQTVLMVPTEVLANQHYRTIRSLTKDLWVDVAVLKGGMPKKDRDNILSGLKNGEIKILIGTHALFSDDVEYKNLGFVVIDEQHRFGVEQRYKLLSKGEGVDLLLMTATPIPQSLALSLYGDLDLIVMRGKIKGRLPVKTWVIEDNEQRILKMHSWIKDTIKENNGRVIFVYPLIEESERLERKDLLNEYEKLKIIYEDIGCELIHSKTKDEDKDFIIESFKIGKTKVLAATTVVEVGLDIPEANIIVVENADTFGLSTLHQLRGRVGRNKKQGYMVLIADMDRISDQGLERLEIFKNETDGFKISEHDLIMRGPGDFIGKRQSGIFDIKLVDIKKDLELLIKSSYAAENVFKNDRFLEKPEHLKTKESFFKRINNYVERDEYM